MKSRNLPSMIFLFYIVLGVNVLPFVVSASFAQEKKGLDALGGDWLYVEDRTKGRAREDQGPRMSLKFGLRVEKDSVVMERARGREEKITLDGSTIKKDNENVSITNYSGKWKDGVLEYSLETIRLSDNQRISQIKRKFRATPDGLQVTVQVNNGIESVSIYQHPNEIAMPTPAKAKIADMDWLSGVWVGAGKSSAEERWTPTGGGAMLGLSRTIAGGKLVAFEYLRIVERDGSLVYIAQPGGRTPTEFVLTKLDKNRAVFDNPRHSFPQRIVYQRSTDGQLTASIGFINGGRPKSFGFKRESK